jgi:IS5 family transposase
MKDLAPESTPYPEALRARARSFAALQDDGVRELGLRTDSTTRERDPSPIRVHALRSRRTSYETAHHARRVGESRTVRTQYPIFISGRVPTDMVIEP